MFKSTGPHLSKGSSSRSTQNQLFKSIGDEILPQVNSLKPQEVANVATWQMIDTAGSFFSQHVLCFEHCERWCFQGVVIRPDEDQTPAAMRGYLPKDGMLDAHCVLQA